jgi:transposase
METPRQKGLATKAKARAAKNKWLPPASWDDDTIDDPSQLPKAPQIIRDCKCKTVKHVHGTVDAYLTDSCRCLPCKEARRIATNHNRRMKAYGRATNSMVDAKPAKKHVKSLMKRGWSVALIAKNARVGTSTVTRLLHGEPAKRLKAPTTILKSTSDRLLSFAPVEDRKRYDGTVLEIVDSIGTQRRVQALICCGYSMTFLANELGVSKQAVHLWMKNDNVSLLNADAVKVIYDKLWDTEPPRNTPAEKKAYTTSKKMALENGWPPPMAWDDDTIDDRKGKAVA